jgi:hypothetical protein
MSFRHTKTHPQNPNILMFAWTHLALMCLCGWRWLTSADCAVLEDHVPRTVSLSCREHFSPERLKIARHIITCNQDSGSTNYKTACLDNFDSSMTYTDGTVSLRIRRKYRAFSRICLLITSRSNTYKYSKKSVPNILTSPRTPSTCPFLMTILPILLE